MKKTILILSMFCATYIYAEEGTCYRYAKERADLYDTNKAFCIKEKDKGVFNFVFYYDYSLRIVDTEISNYKKGHGGVVGATVFRSRTNPIVISFCDWDQPYAGSCHSIHLHNEEIGLSLYYEIKRTETANGATSTWTDRP